MSTATITLPVGPGLTVSSLVIGSVKSVNYNFVSKVLTVITEERIHEFDYDAAVTVTMTISGDNTTVTVSS